VICSVRSAHWDLVKSKISLIKFYTNVIIKLNVEISFEIDIKDQKATTCI